MLILRLLLTLPDLLINLLLSGGLSAVLVPRFRSLSSDQADALFCRALLTATSAFALIAILVLSWPNLFLYYWHQAFKIELTYPTAHR